MTQRKKTRTFNILITEQDGSFEKSYIWNVSADINIANILKGNKKIIRMVIMTSKKEAEQSCNKKKALEGQHKRTTISKFLSRIESEELRRDFEFYIRTHFLTIKIDGNTMELQEEIHPVKTVIYNYGGYGIYYIANDEKPHKIISNGNDGLDFGDAIANAELGLVFDYETREFKKAG